MSWFAILMMIIQYGPAIWRVVKEIIDLIKSMKSHEQPALHDELKAAVDAYKVHRDRRPLQDLRDRLRARRV